MKASHAVFLMLQVNLCAKSEDEVSTRRFWQMHLSTAIVLMLLAGLLLLMNVSVKMSVTITRNKLHPNDGDLVAKAWIGWPVSIPVDDQSCSRSLAIIERTAEKFYKDWKGKTILSFDYGPRHLTKYDSEILSNIAVNVGILFCAWFCIELYIRESKAD
jgi:hypothetical protein